MGREGLPLVAAPVKGGAVLERQRGERRGESADELSEAGDEEQVNGGGGSWTREKAHTGYGRLLREGIWLCMEMEGKVKVKEEEGEGEEKRRRLGEALSTAHRTGRKELNRKTSGVVRARNSKEKTSDEKKKNSLSARSPLDDDEETSSLYERNDGKTTKLCFEGRGRGMNNRGDSEKKVKGETPRF